MRNAKNIVRDILILKLGDKNTAETEKNRLTEMVKCLDADISGGMLSTQENFLLCLQKQMNGTEIGKTTLSMLNAVYKTHTEPKTISMLGKLLFMEKNIQDDYTLILLYRLLEHSGLTLRAVPNGYDALRRGISGNKLLDFTEPMQADKTVDITDEDLLKALFVMNDEPDGDISCVKDCSALREYKRIVNEAAGMSGTVLANIADYTSYPNMVLVLGLRLLSKAGKPIEFRKEALERLVMSILTRQAVGGLAIS